MPTKSDFGEGLTLLDLIQRDMAPKTWAEGGKIPWDDPDFSRRMLKEHLSQKHDAASRRKKTIKKHVEWMHAYVLAGRPSYILDLGCGPGLYTTALAKLGHTCHGIDFSPAAIDYAAKNTFKGCTYTLGDIRTTEYGSGYDLVMLIFGEFNVFHPQDAQRILDRSYAALKPGGKLLLEVSTFDAVFEMGNQPATWYTAKNELFADGPHLCLMESFWDDDQHVAIERYYIVDATSGGVRRFVAATQANDEKGFETLLEKAGFRRVDMYPSLTGKDTRQISPLVVFIAEK